MDILRGGDHMKRFDTDVGFRYKDRLFRFLFGSEKRKNFTLDLYNALNGTSYDNADDLELTTLDDVIYMSMKNDVSFILDGYMNLYEQQSTYNPNMPIRILMYLGRLYDKYINEHELNVYGRKLNELPTPKAVVLYNGTEDRPAFETLRLSDAFEFPEQACVELIAEVININYRCNASLLRGCDILRQYSVFIDEIRKGTGLGLDLRIAVDNAVRYCIDNGILKDILQSHLSEVVDLVLTEYDEKKVMEMFYEEARKAGREDGLAEGRAEGHAEGRAEGHAEGRAEGRAEGHAEGRAEGLIEGKSKDMESLRQMISDGKISLNISEEEFYSILRGDDPV